MRDSLVIMEVQQLITKANRILSSIVSGIECRSRFNFNLVVFNGETTSGVCWALLALFNRGCKSIDNNTENSYHRLVPRLGKLPYKEMLDRPGLYPL